MPHIPEHESWRKEFGIMLGTRWQLSDPREVSIAQGGVQKPDSAAQTLLGSFGGDR